MSSSDCIPVSFVSTCASAFYFNDGGSDELDTDSFMKSCCSSTYKLQCKDSKYLLLNAEENFLLQHLTMAEQCQQDCIFNIHPYNNSAMQRKQGVAVMLYAQKDGKKVVACCRDNQIYPEAMDLPMRIEESQHKALFLLTRLFVNKFMFESLVYPSSFLGFEPDSDDPTRKKLVLRHKGPDGVDDWSEFRLSKCQA